MNEVTQYKKQFMLTTFSKGKFVITEQKQKALQSVGANTMVNIDGNMINSSNIAEIVELGAYYRQHPEEKPAPELKSFENSKPIPFTLARNRRALESMIRGLEKCVREQGYPMSLNQKKIYDKIFARLKDLDGLTEETYKAKDFKISDFFKV